MYTINKLILHNFKRFRDLEINLNPEKNIFIGDNESGKSSILQAIELVARGSRHRVEEISLERLFNVQAIEEFMSGARRCQDLPEMRVELWLDNISVDLQGANNSKNDPHANGIKLLVKPDERFSNQIMQILASGQDLFPIEYYCVEFDTFAGVPYTAHNKWIHSVFIDNSQIGSPYAMREYVHRIYTGKVTDEDRINNRHEYHKSKLDFQHRILDQFSTSIAPYSFTIRESSDDNIETDISLLDNNIPIENKGTGEQCFIKTDLALNSNVNAIDMVLIEEPETHLCYTKTLKLIEKINHSQNRQLFISTHSDLIATRLDLRKCMLLNSSNTAAISMAALTEDTAKFFMKAPDNNMLQFVLSKKVILVEGDAEFILMEAMYQNTVQKNLSDSEVGVIAVDGKCFKRYLEIAKLLNIKVAVITDNDKNYDNNITANYADFVTDNSRVFSDTDNNRYTFEVCLEADNKALLAGIFNNLRTNTVLEFMIANKAEAAYRILVSKGNDIAVPQYIQVAIRWIDA